MSRTAPLHIIALAPGEPNQMDAKPAMTSATTCGPTLVLRPGELASVDLAHGERRLLCVDSGLLWATMEGDPADHVLSSGDSQIFVGPGRLVLESLSGESRGSCEAGGWSTPPRGG